MRTENDLRDAFRTLAAEAPDTESVLDHRSGNGAKRGRPRLVAPITAAAAVIAIAVASVVMTAGGGGSGTGPAPAATGNALPEYYVATVLSGTTTIRDTRTGAVLATVRLPVGYGVRFAAGAGNDRSFVLALESAGVIRLFRLRFDPATRQTSLNLLPIPAVSDFSGLAMSPAGTQIAAVLLDGSKHSELRIYSLTGRLVRRWQGPGQICFPSGIVPCLSWADNGTLAFNWVYRGLFVLHTGAASGPLSAVARLVVPSSRVWSQALSQDGSKIAAVVRHLDRPGSTSEFFEFEEFSVASGKLISRPAGKRHFGLFVIWSNPSGSSLIVRVREGAPSPVGVLAGGRFVPLRGLPDMGVAAIAF